MKNALLWLIVVCLVLGTLLTACAPPPPPVSKQQLDTAEKAALDEEASTAKLKAEKEQLEQELARKKTELSTLESYKRELGIQ